jgi:hypothetical protein
LNQNLEKKMTNASVLPDHCLCVGHAHEVNFVVQMFRKLSFLDQHRLAILVLAPATNPDFAEAGNKLIGLMDKDGGQALTDYMNQVLYKGEPIISLYAIWPHERQIKATVLAYYFREYLCGSEQNGYTIPEITLPHRLVK